jgi:D-threo-aldose 1-dehydrogenase
MTVLPKRRVGKTKLEVTTLGLGGAPMGGFRATISGAEAVTLTDAAYQGGVRYFDTSPFYGYGRSELRMGAALREKPREDFVLSTKVGRILHAMKPGEKKPADFRENGLPGFAPVFDYTYDGVMRSLEHSHLRLGLAKIDIALIHDVDFWTIKDRKILDERFKTVMDSGFKALDELRKGGSSVRSASASTSRTPACASSRPATSTACCWPAAIRCWNRAGSRSSCPSASSATCRSSWAGRTIRAS